MLNCQVQLLKYPKREEEDEEEGEKERIRVGEPRLLDPVAPPFFLENHPKNGIIQG